MFAASPSYRYLLLIIGISLISACGGGGGGSSAPAAVPPVTSSPPPAPPATGFANGTFEPFENFEQMCATPRTGSDGDGVAFPDTQGTTEDENNGLRSWSHELYLWYDEILDVDPASLSTPDYFEQMQTFDITPSGAPKDKFHFTIPTDEWQAQSSGGISGGYGVTFAILQGFPPRQVVVAYTEPGTPATAPAVNLRRGTTILEIDGVDMVNSNNVNVLNAGLFPGTMRHIPSWFRMWMLTCPER